jgi:hypothetical protein
MTSHSTSMKVMELRKTNKRKTDRFFFPTFHAPRKTAIIFDLSPFFLCLDNFRENILSKSLGNLKISPVHVNKMSVKNKINS